MYEIMTRWGILTVVIDPKSMPPIRLYDRDGMEVDPVHVCWDKLGEMAHLAYDLSEFAVQGRLN